MQYLYATIRYKMRRIFRS